MLKNLKRLREKSAVTQKQLAEAIGVSQQSINKYENHKIEPDIETMIRICEFFHTSLDYLVGYAEECSPSSGWELRDEEARLLEGYRTLSPRKKKSVQEIIDNYNT